MPTYWEAREQEALYNELLKEGEKQLIAQYRRSAYTVLSLLLDLYAGGVPTITDIYKYNRYYELLGLLNSDLKALGAKEVAITTTLLTDMYIKNKAIIGDGNMLLPTSPKEVEMVINKIWCADGKHWSSRIWTHKDELANKLRNGIVDCISRGVSKDELTKELMRIYGTEFYKADRIARTELSYVQGQSTLNRFKEMGVGYYKILTAHDGRVCDKCADLDGKIFPVDKAEIGVNYIPLHVHDRCTILPITKRMMTDTEELK